MYRYVKIQLRREWTTSMMNHSFWRGVYGLDEVEPLVPFEHLEPLEHLEPFEPLELLKPLEPNPGYKTKT